MATYIARKYKSLRLVIEPRSSKEVEGRRIQTGLHGRFLTGKTIEFNQGEYTTNDPREIEAIDSHPEIGLSFYRADRQGVDTPSDEAVAKYNEKREVVESVTNTCPECGFNAKSDFGLQAHMRKHEG